MEGWKLRGTWRLGGADSVRPWSRRGILVRAEGLPAGSVRVQQPGQHLHRIQQSARLHYGVRGLPNDGDAGWHCSGGQFERWRACCPLPGAATDTKPGSKKEPAPRSRSFRGPKRGSRTRTQCGLRAGSRHLCLAKCPPHTASACRHMNAHFIKIQVSKGLRGRLSVELGQESVDWIAVSADRQGSGLLRIL